MNICNEDINLLKAASTMNLAHCESGLSMIKSVVCEYFNVKLV